MAVLSPQAIQEWCVDKTVVRKVMQGVASLGPAACLFALASDQGTDSHAAFISLCVATFSVLFAASPRNCYLLAHVCK